MTHADTAIRVPAAVAAYVEASNKGDGAAVMATFADDALVNDVQREFRGKAAIRAWVEREIFGDKVTMEVIEVSDRNGDVAVTARLDGTYDKTGLPDPLLLTYYFSLRGGLINTLIVLLNKSAP